MDINDIKVYALSLFGFTMTFSGIEDILKIVLLIISIIYTLIKIVELQETRRSKNKSKNKRQ